MRFKDTISSNRIGGLIGRKPLVDKRLREFGSLRGKICSYRTISIRSFEMQRYQTINPGLQ
jgi:hypothetical protein